MVSQIKSYIGSTQGSSGTFGDTDLPEFAPEWIPLPNLDTNFLDLPDSFNVAPYATGRPAPTFTSDIGVMTPEGILTIPAGTAIGPLVITITASNSEGDTPTTLNWDITVEDTPEPTLYVNSLYAGGNPPTTPPTNHARGFGTGDASEEIGRDNATHIYTTSGNSERWYLIHNETNYPDLEVGKGYVFAVDIECFAGSNTNAIALSNPVNITVGQNDRTCAPGEHKICYVTFTVDAPGYAFTYLCGTGITTGRSETYRFHTPRLIELGEIVPIWDEVPPQETNVADLPDQLDMKDFILNDILIIDWETTFGEIDVDGILEIPAGTEPDTYPIVVTAIATSAQSESDEFIWRILPETDDPPVWGPIDNAYANINDLPVEVEMDQFVTGDNLTDWALSGNPSGVTIDELTGTLEVDATVPASRFTMTCFVRNPGGSDTSDEFTGLVADIPVIDTQPTSQDFDEPLGGSFVVEASPPDPEAQLYYQWQAERFNDPGNWTEIQNVYSDINLAAFPEVEVISTNEEDFLQSPINTRCRVRAYLDDLEEFETFTAVVTGTINRLLPTITSDPDDVEVVAPEGTTFTVEATHPTGASLFYTWEASPDSGTTWLLPDDVLSDVDPSSVNASTLILNSTSTDAIEPPEGPPSWRNVSHDSVIDTEADDYTRNMTVFVESESDLFDWSTTFGSITPQGIYSLPGGTGVGTHPVTVAVSNDFSEDEPSNAWNVNVILSGGGGPTEQPLFDLSDLTYAGEFDIPDLWPGVTFGFGGHCMEIADGGTSLYLGATDNTQGGQRFIGKVTIPAFGQTAAVLIEPKFIPGEISSQCGHNTSLHSLLDYNGRLIISHSCTYETLETGNTKSHTACDYNLDNVLPYTDFEDRENTGLACPMYAGYMGHIPPEWQALMGGPAFAGNNTMSIISRNSAGPSFYVFDPDNVNGVDRIPYEELQFYHYIDAPLADWEHPNNHFCRSDQWNSGMIWIPGTRSIMFMGRHGFGQWYYGSGNTGCGTFQGEHNTDYRMQVMAWDANDLLKVKNGEALPGDARPYAWRELPGPSTSCSEMPSGAMAYDPSIGRIYTTWPQTELLKIHAYDLPTFP